MVLDEPVVQTVQSSPRLVCEVQRWGLLLRGRGVPHGGGGAVRLGPRPGRELGDRETGGGAQIGSEDPVVPASIPIACVMGIYFLPTFVWLQLV